MLLPTSPYWASAILESRLCDGDLHEEDFLRRLLWERRGEGPGREKPSCSHTELLSWGSLAEALIGAWEQGLHFTPQPAPWMRAPWGRQLPSTRVTPRQSSALSFLWPALLGEQDPILKGDLGGAPECSLRRPTCPQPSSCLFLLGFPLNYSVLSLSSGFLIQLCLIPGFLAPFLSRSPDPHPPCRLLLPRGYTVIAQHSPWCQPVPVATSFHREQGLIFCLSSLLKSQPASAHSKICMWPRSHKQAVEMLLGRKEQDFGHFGKQVRCSPKVKNPHPHPPDTRGHLPLQKLGQSFGPLLGLPTAHYWGRDRGILCREHRL